MKQQFSLQLAVFAAIICSPISAAFRESEAEQTVDGLRTSVFHTPAYYLGPGSAMNKYYFDIPFPKGHIAIKSFNAEVVDDNGDSVPLYEAYLHHWLVWPYYGQKNISDQHIPDLNSLAPTKPIFLRNNGICRDVLQEYFGVGSETRKTDSWIPNPYGVEVGNPEKIPDGYELRWTMNVHTIDTRGTEDRMGCTECRCDLYNVTTDEDGKPLPKDYVGGLNCCYDKTQCRLRKGAAALFPTRKLYAKYTVKWLDWVESIVPVKIYVLDITAGEVLPSGNGTDLTLLRSCEVEYNIEACIDESTGICVNRRRKTVNIPDGGSIVYAVAHQHPAGLGAVLYSQDGRLLCESKPMYGNGTEAGNEAGYIVGMSACYPDPEITKVQKGEQLTYEQHYNSNEEHTGLMGLFYILVAEQSPISSASTLSSLDSWKSLLMIILGIFSVYY